MNPNDQEVEVTLTLHTAPDDVEPALERSGITNGALIGEALVTGITVYSRDDEE